MRVGDLVPIVAARHRRSRRAPRGCPPARSREVPDAAGARRPAAAAAVPRRLPVLGALAVGAGCALLAMAVAGAREAAGARRSGRWSPSPAAWRCVLGAIAIGPVGGVGARAGRARPAPTVVRVAGRSLARNRVRSSAVIGAICAVATWWCASAPSTRAPAPADVDQPPYLMQDELIIGSNETRPSADPDGQTYSSGPRPTEAIEGVRGRRPRRGGDPAAHSRPPGAGGCRRAGRRPCRAPPTWALTARASAARRASWRSRARSCSTHLEVPPRLRAALAQGEAIALERPAPADRRRSASSCRSATRGSTRTGPEIPFGGSFDSPHASDGCPAS